MNHTDALREWVVTEKGLYNSLSLRVWSVQFFSLAFRVALPWRHIRMSSKNCRANWADSPN